MFKIKKIDHFVITTAKPSECIEFYTKIGFDVRFCGSHYELFAGDFKINVHILNQELSPKAKNVTTGSADFCFEIDGDLDIFIEELKLKNVNIELGIVDRNGVKGKMRSIYLRDPDENLVEFSEY